MQVAAEGGHDAVLKLLREQEAASTIPSYEPAIAAAAGHADSDSRMTNVPVESISIGFPDSQQTGSQDRWHMKGGKSSAESKWRWQTFF